MSKDSHTDHLQTFSWFPEAYLTALRYAVRNTLYFNELLLQNSLYRLQNQCVSFTVVYDHKLSKDLVSIEACDCGMALSFDVSA